MRSVYTESADGVPRLPDTVSVAIADPRMTQMAHSDKHLLRAQG